MDEYRYIDGEYEIKREVKRSIFIASVKGEADSVAAEDFIKAVKKRYPDATHHCYAYIGDILGNSARFSDDGEPSGTAGQPILDVLKKQGLKKSVVVVTRYFGGIKLGASGLVGAYSSAAADGVKAANISLKRKCAAMTISLGYPDLAALTSLLMKSGCKIASQQFEDGAKIGVYVPLDGVENLKAGALEVSAGRVKIEIADDIEFVKL